MSELDRQTTTVVLSFGYFTLWWLLLLGVHLVTSAYTALYAYAYWDLKNTFLNTYLEPFQIGMPAPYHLEIAIIHGTVSAIHLSCALLMIGGSLRQRSLAFTPTTSCLAGSEDTNKDTSRTDSVVLQSFSKAYTTLSDLRRPCGVNGEHFHTFLLVREIIETVLQTVQAYRMSKLLPRTILNRFYVLLLVVNCWSAALVYFFYRHEEARRRFVCVTLDCLLDLIASMGVQLIILMS